MASAMSKRGIGAREWVATLVLVRGIPFRGITVSEFFDERKPDAAEWGRRLTTANFNPSGGTFLGRRLAEHVDLKGADGRDARRTGHGFVVLDARHCDDDFGETNPIQQSGAKVLAAEWPGRFWRKGPGVGRFLKRWNVL